MPITFADLQSGTTVFTTTYPVQRANLIRYAGASGDFNPIHWSESTATNVGLPNVIAHGMYTMALAGRAVAQWCGDAGRVRDLRARFTKPVVVPDGEVVDVEFTGTVKHLDAATNTATVAITARCADVSVLGRALAEVKLP